MFRLFWGPISPSLSELSELVLRFWDGNTGKLKEKKKNTSQIKVCLVVIRICFIFVNGFPTFYGPDCSLVRSYVLPVREKFIALAMHASY